MQSSLELSEGVLELCSDSTRAVIGAFERAAKQLRPMMLCALWMSRAAYVVSLHVLLGAKWGFRKLVEA